MGTTVLHKFLTGSGRCTGLRAVASPVLCAHALVVVLTLVQTRLVAAQSGDTTRVHIVVVSEAGEPLGTALVTVRDSEDRIVARGVSDRNGVLVLDVPARPTVSFAVDRIGYAAWRSEKRAITVEIVLRIPVQPLRLGAIDVDGRVNAIGLAAITASVDPRCPSTTSSFLGRAAEGVARIFGKLVGVQSRELPERIDRGPVLVRVGELTQRALADVLKERTPGTRFQIRTIAETPYYDDKGKVATSVDTVVTEQASPLTSPTSEWLAQSGFIEPRKAAEGLPVYHAPTPEIITSDAFFLTHCFGVSQHPDSQWVGLAFEPVPGHDNSDVAGVIWIDTTAVRPIRIEYRYVGLGDFLARHERKHALALIPGGGLTEFRNARERDRNWATERVQRPRYYYTPPQPNESKFGGVINFAMVGSSWDVSHRTIVWPALEGAARSGQSSSDGYVRRYDISFVLNFLPHSTIAETIGVARPAK